MKTSVLVIAYNEEKHIGACLESLLAQTTMASEIVVIAHNCSDRTVDIVKKYPVRLVQFDGPSGIIHARLKGLEEVTGDIVLCIDGDSIAQRNWIEVMSGCLQERKNILVGSWVRFTGTFYDFLSNLSNRIFCRTKNEAAATWIWGASMGFWAKDKEIVGKIFERSIELSQELRLTRNPHDYWLALYMSRHGNIEVTNKTHVTAHAKEETVRGSIARNRENHNNGTIMDTYFNQNGINL